MGLIRRITPESPASGVTSAPDSAVLRWLVGATFVVILNETIMINAIPRLMADFGVNANTAQWLSTAFMLTMAVVIPVTGWFLQRVTTRFAFGLAMGVFCAGTLLAAAAWTFPVLLVARVVQASGTAVMLPLLMTTLMGVVPAHDRGRVMGNVTLAISVAPALGPAVSGVILQSLSWRWIFLVVLPIAAGIGVLGLRRLVNVGEPVAGSLDWGSVVIAALGFGTLVYGLSEVGVQGDHTLAIAALVVGVVGIGCFVWRQLVLQRTDQPLLDLRALRVKVLSPSLGVMAIAFRAMLGSMILLQLYLQTMRGMSPLATGMLVMPGGLAMGLLGPRVGRIYDTRGARVLVVPGAIGPAPGHDQLHVPRPGNPDLADPGRARVADGQPGRVVHARVHHGPRLLAAAPLLPWQLTAGHHPAGRRSDGYGAGRDDHDQPRSCARPRRRSARGGVAGGYALGVRRSRDPVRCRARPGSPAACTHRRPRRAGGSCRGAGRYPHPQAGLNPAGLAYRNSLSCLPYTVETTQDTSCSPRLQPLLGDRPAP
jgi:MFS transporter, DHA2 family, lincomycin resistance protein